MKYTITVTNWEKNFQLRKDVSNPSWFKLSNNFFNQIEFGELNALSLLTFLIIIAYCSQKNCNFFTISENLLAKNVRVSKKNLQSLLQQLKNHELIQIINFPDFTPTCGYQHADVPRIEKNRIEKKRKEYTENSKLVAEMKTLEHSVAKTAPHTQTKPSVKKSKQQRWTCEELAKLAHETLEHRGHKAPLVWTTNAVERWLQAIKLSGKAATRGYFANWVRVVWERECDDVVHEIELEKVLAKRPTDFHANTESSHDQNGKSEESTCPTTTQIAIKTPRIGLESKNEGRPGTEVISGEKSGLKAFLERSGVPAERVEVVLNEYQEA